MYKIAFDVMGADKGLEPAVQAGTNFLKRHTKAKITFVGDKAKIKKILNQKNLPTDRYEILGTTEVIGMEGSILELRRKKDASIVRALELVRDGFVDGMLTAGNSGTFIGGAHFILGELPDIKRPGFMPTWATLKPNHTTVLLDAGANAENTAEDLLNYARLATTYVQSVLHIAQPKVGLLNIGTENSKGDTLHKEAFKLLQKESNINFLGNLEANDLFSGKSDIIVSDGFSGNIAIKSVEGSLKSLLTVMKTAFTKTPSRKIAAFTLRSAFGDIKDKFDYKSNAGAILLGVDGIAFKSHGASDEEAFYSTLSMTYNAIKTDVLKKMKAHIVEKTV